MYQNRHCCVSARIATCKLVEMLEVALERLQTPCLFRILRIQSVYDVLECDDVGACPASSDMYPRKMSQLFVLAASI